MMFQEYPKALYLRGWDDLDAVVTVLDAEAEAAARAQGYRGINEAPPAQDVPLMAAPELEEMVAAELAAADAEQPRRRPGRPRKDAD